MSNIKDRSTLVLDQFLGVDFTNSPLKVDQRRAVNGVNFITDYGTIKKRPGWIERIRFNDEKVSGMFAFMNFIIVRAGNHIYRLNLDLSYSTLYTITQKDNEQVSFFVMNSNVYIVGLGAFLFLHQTDIDEDNNAVYSIHKVSDYATVPRTSISIDDTAASSQNRVTFEQINLLTPKRINQLIGRNVINLSWDLDGLVASDDDGIPLEVLVDIDYVSGSNVLTKHYKTFPDQSGVEKYLYDVDEVDFSSGNQKGELVGGIIGTSYRYSWKRTAIPVADNSISRLVGFDEWGNPITDESSGTVTTDYTKSYLDTGASGTPTSAELDTAVKSSSYTYGKTIKYTDNLGLVTYWICRRTTVNQYSENYKQLKIYETTESPVEGSDNIIVTYTADDVFISEIEKANRGIVFGVNGTTNQLFLASGATEYYSKAYDFNYFPDTQINVLGNSGNPIVGYSRLSDTALAIFKDDQAKESRLFFRTMDLSADSSTYETEYTLYDKAVDVNIGCDAPGSIENLAGDNLFLSKLGVYAVTLGDNVSVESRHVRERSMYVNKKLVLENIEKGKAIVFDNRYYLAIDGSVYVADARYRTSSNMDDTFNYEFYYWNNVPVSSWVILNNQLWFGTEDGRICQFDSQYSDRRLIKSTTGQLTLDQVNNNIVYNPILEINNDDEIYINTYQMLHKAVDIASIVSGVITSDIDDLELILYEGQTVYIKDVDSNLTEEVPYTIYGLNLNQFYLKDSNGDLVTSITGTFDIIKSLEFEKMYVCNMNFSSYTFQLKKHLDGEYVDLVSYTSDPLIFTIVTYKSVDMVWFSPIFDLGNNMYTKTLFGMTISADAGDSGNVRYGYDVKNIPSNIQKFIYEETIDFDQLSENFKDLNYKVFDFNDVNFNEFELLTNHASNYMKRIKEKDFNYIILKIGSASNEFATVNGVSLIYKMNNLLKGNR